LVDLERLVGERLGRQLVLRKLVHGLLLLGHHVDVLEDVALRVRHLHRHARAAGHREQAGEGGDARVADAAGGIRAVHVQADEVRAAAAERVPAGARQLDPQLQRALAAAAYRRVDRRRPGRGRATAAAPGLAELLEPRVDRQRGAVEPAPHGRRTGLPARGLRRGGVDLRDERAVALQVGDRAAGVAQEQQLDALGVLEQARAHGRGGLRVGQPLGVGDEPRHRAPGLRKRAGRLG
jgi:hypothetical protein